MKIQDKYFYFGAVLAQIAEYPTFTSINKVTKTEGIYQINDCTRILIRYSKSDGPEWRFTIGHYDYEDFWQYNAFFVLVCAGHTICLLDQSDIKVMVNIDDESPQWITVSCPEGGQMRVNGPLGGLPHKIPHNAFPQKLLQGGFIYHEPSAWPALSKLNLYWTGPPVIPYTTEDRMFHFGDFLLTHDEGDPLGMTVYIGFSSIDHLWTTWTNENLSKIEEHIRNQVECSWGITVDIERVSKAQRGKTQSLKNCSTEFVWKLHIPCEDNNEDEVANNNAKPGLTNGRDDEEPAVDAGPEPEVRLISAKFPSLVSSKGKPVCPIEIDVDSLQRDKGNKCEDWEELIKGIAARWVKANSFSGKGTIWAWGTPSVNFNHQSYSVFYAVVGMPDSFRKLLGAEIETILGAKYVRSNSDYVSPSQKEGWKAKCHIEDCKTWEIWDASAWQELKV